MNRLSTGDEIESILTVAGLQHVIAEFAENAGEQGADTGIVRRDAVLKDDGEDLLPESVGGGIFPEKPVTLMRISWKSAFSSTRSSLRRRAYYSSYSTRLRAMWRRMRRRKVPCL